MKTTEEIIYELNLRINTHSFNADQLRGTKLFAPYKDIIDHYVNLLKWIKNEEEMDLKE